VRAYTRRSLDALFQDLPTKTVHTAIVFGAYDNIIQRWPLPGRALRALLVFLERTPLKILGLSHFRVVEKLKQ
jgi:hypothetical protein